MASELRLLRAAVTLATCLCVSASAAEPTAAEKEVARTLMDQGDELVKSKDLRAALKAYEAADAIMAVPTTRIEVARTQAALGLLVQAHDAALSVATIPERPNEPSPFVEARAEARQLAAELERRVPMLTVRVRGLGPEAQPVVHVDGTPVPAERIGQPARLDPGRHFVSVAAPRHAAMTREVTLVERDRTRIDIDLQATGAPSGAGRATPVEPARRGVPPLALAAFGLGAVGVGIGVGTGIASLARASNAREHCNGDVCTPAAADDIDGSRALARVSDVAFGVGLVGIAAGVVLVLVQDEPLHVGRSPFSGTF